MPELVQLLPADEHNAKLRANVHPSDWANPQPDKPYHLVVIGAGTAGLVTAAGAAGLGARVALVERELMGGDCLNVGCVPSKGLISAARVAATVGDASEFGTDLGGKATFDFSRSMERMRRLRAEISPNDSAERFTSLGVDMYFGQGSFVDNDTIKVTRDDGSISTLKYRKAVIATGARAAAPPIPGLEAVDYLTNESVFSLTKLPRRFGIIGNGPIGCEMAQVFARFGSDVTLIGRGGRLLPREDPDASEIVARHFERDSVAMHLDSSDLEARAVDDGVRLRFQNDGSHHDVLVDKLLVAVGRAPNTDKLNLESVNVEHTAQGVEVDEFMQTSNPRIFAAGDICSQFKFTHAADFQARAVIQNALFAVGPFGKKKASELVIPWATYTTPEVAHVGHTAQSAATAGIEIDTYVQDMADVDRAILDGQTAGFVKVHTKKGSDRIVGATIVAENAGDMISEITLAMNNKVGLGSIASTIHPYPTQAEAIRKVGDQFNRTKLTPTSKKILNLLRRFNVGD